MKLVKTENWNYKCLSITFNNCHRKEWTVELPMVRFQTEDFSDIDWNFDLCCGSNLTTISKVITEILKKLSPDIKYCHFSAYNTDENDYEVDIEDGWYCLEDDIWEEE